jgi:uroporphyrinogen decarboxylase
MTSKEERLRAAIDGEVADRPPVALWRHFPVDDQDPLALANATLNFQSTYDFDFIKVSPASSFCILDWGVEDEWYANPEGTREYTYRVIREPHQWKKLETLDPSSGFLGKQLECLERLQMNLDGQTPFIQTIFSPLAQAKNLAGVERLFVHIRQDPQSVLYALEKITQTTLSFIEQARKRAIAGIFYAIQHASYQFFDRDGYATFGEPFDRRILEAVRDLWLNVLHLHGEDLMFELAETLPVQVVNWHDRETRPELAEGKSRLKAAVCGGLRRWDTIVLGNADSVYNEAQDAVTALDGGRGMILGTGCVVPVVAPHGNLMAARKAVENLK